MVDANKRTQLRAAMLTSKLKPHCVFRKPFHSSSAPKHPLLHYGRFSSSISGYGFPSINARIRNHEGIVQYTNRYFARQLNLPSLGRRSPCVGICYHRGTGAAARLRYSLPWFGSSRP